jgi:uncharacterized protein YlxW (UPF0749 family)
VPRSKPIRFITNAEGYIIWSSSMKNLHSMTKVELIKQFKELNKQMSDSVSGRRFDAEVAKRQQAEQELRQAEKAKQYLSNEVRTLREQLEREKRIVDKLVRL